MQPADYTCADYILAHGFLHPSDARREWRRARPQGMKMWAPTSHTYRRHYFTAYDIEKMFKGLVPKQGAMRTPLADGFQSMLAAPGQLMRKLMRRRQAR